MSNFLIKTPGRTGSHIFTDYLRKNHYNNVKHCQEMWVPDNTENWIFILSKRRNWFNMACSRVITSHTKQYGPYKITEKLQVNTDIESLIDSAGYARLDDVDFTVFSSDELEALKNLSSDSMDFEN